MSSFKPASADPADPVRHASDGENEQRLRAIVDTAVDGIVTIDERGIIESFNPAAERLFGYAAAEAIGSNVSILVPEPERSQHDEHITAYLRTGEAKIIGRGREVMGRRRDGTLFPMHLSISEVPLEGGRLFTGMIRDMSDLVASRREVQRQRDFAESLIETAHTIVLLLDPDGRVVRFNTYMEDLCGRTSAESRGVDWFETFLPERERARTRRVFEAVLRGETAEGNVNAILNRRGEEREIAWWGKTLEDVIGGVTGVLSVGHDVTDLTRLQEKLLQSERLSAIGEAMTSLAHESRNALARSHANLRMLKRRLVDEPELVELIERSLRAQEDIRLLFDEVRQYAAPILLRPEPTNLERLVRETWSELELARLGRDAELEVVLTTSDVVVPADRFAMRNVVRNLLENALAIGTDPVRVHVRIDPVTSDTLRDGIRLSIRDNGPGIPEADRPRLFDAFFTTRTQGTGLGLAIVRRIVEQHGGEVGLGRPDEGAEFVVTMPRGDA